MIQLIIASHSPLYRQGIRLLIDRANFTIDAVEASNYHELKEACAAYSMTEKARNRRTIAVIDSALCGLDQFSVLGELIRQHRCRMLMMTESHEATFYDHCLDQGIAGVFAKSDPTEVILAAINAVVCGKNWFKKSVRQAADAPKQTGRLTDKHRNVMSLIKKGYRNKQIARELGIPDYQVRYYVSQLYKKYDIPIRSRALLATAV